MIVYIKKIQNFNFDDEKVNTVIAIMVRELRWYFAMKLQLGKIILFDHMKTIKLKFCVFSLRIIKLVIGEIA